MIDLTDFKFEPDLARAATMPSRWYTAPEFLALEKERIFARTWQAVGRIDEVARIGDFFTCEVLGVILQETAHIPLTQMRPVERRDYVIDCNWKVYIDNYLEGYHVPIAHPGLYRELDYENYKVETHRYHSRQLAPLRPVTGNGG